MRGWLLLLSSLMACVWSNAGWSQNYPNRPVRIIVGFETGGGPDTTARIIGPQLSLQTGQQFISIRRFGEAARLAEIEPE
jgi:tripartite-type tricarboxylate transporter receptor subunit TctC